MNYDPSVHVRSRACVKTTEAGRIRYTTHPRTGDAAHLVAEPADGRRPLKTWAMLTVYDPDGNPRAHYHSPGAYVGVARREDLAAAESYLSASNPHPTHPPQKDHP